MILNHLSLRGAIGIKDGLGLDQIDIDFTQFAPGLIAIMGPNGSGKSTLVENLAPFRSLRSRPGSLARQFCLKDSHRDLRVTIGADDYRFLLSINADANKLESVIFKNGVAMNPDGKEASYNEIVESLFGPERLFYLSLFMPQRRDSFASLPPVERKEVLLKLMGAERIQPKCEYAGKRATAADSEIEKIELAIKGLSDRLVAIGNPEAVLAELNGQLTACVEGAQAAEAVITAIEGQIEYLLGKEKDQAVIAEKITQAEARITELRKQRETVVEDYRKRISTVDAERRKAAAERDRLAVGRSDATLESMKAAAAQVEQVRAAYLASAELGQRHADLQRQLGDVRAAYSEAKRKYQEAESQAVAARDKAKNELDRATREFDTEYKRLSNDLDRKRYAAQTLKSVPCQQTAEAEACRQCQFLRDATQAESEIDAAQGALNELMRVWTYETKPTLERACQTADASCTMPVFEQSTLVIVDGENIIDKGKRLAEEASALGYDPAKAAALKRQFEANQAADPAERLREYEANGEKIMQLEAVMDGAVEQQHGLEVERDEKLEGVDNQIIDLQHDKATLQDQADITIPLKLRDKRADLAAKRQAADGFTAKRQDILTRQEQVQKDIGTADQIRTEIDGHRTTVAALRADAADWSHLSNSLSRNGGFQSMLVESFGGEISAFINERLPSYGLPWSVEIATSKPSADGKKMVEGFWVMINADPFPRELGLVSGGQEVWIEALIYDAIAHLMGRRSGKKLLTAIRDEADGALTEENAIIYSQVIEASHRASGLHHTLLITHRPEIQRRIGQRLVFVKGEGIRTEIE